MYNMLPMQVGQSLQDLRQIIDHDLLFLLQQFYALVDGLHEVEEIAIGTELHHDADVVLLL